MKVLGPGPRPGTRARTRAGAGTRAVARARNPGHWDPGQWDPGQYGPNNNVDWCANSRLRLCCICWVSPRSDFDLIEPPHVVSQKTLLSSAKHRLAVSTDFHVCPSSRGASLWPTHALAASIVSTLSLLPAEASAPGPEYAR